MFEWPAEWKGRGMEQDIDNVTPLTLGAGRSSEVERSLIMPWVVGSIRVAYVAAAGFLSHYQNGP